MLRELAPLSAIGPVTLREVRDVLTPRLSTLTHEPPRRRHGRVFVGTPARRPRSIVPHRVRARSCRANVPAAHPRRCAPARHPARGRRQRACDPAATSGRRTIAVDARGRRRIGAPVCVVSTGRAERIAPARAVVLRARHRASDRGAHSTGSDADGARVRSGRRRARWPAPQVAGTAIDDFEHDLATMKALLRNTSDSVKGRARYLYELSPELQRSLTSRWLRWHSKVGSRRRHRAIDRCDTRRAGRAAPRRAALFVDRAAALFGVPVSIPDGGDLSPRAARSAGAAPENGSAHARRPVPPDAGRRASPIAGRWPAAAVARHAAATRSSASPPRSARCTIVNTTASARRSIASGRTRSRR